MRIVYLHRMTTLSTALVFLALTGMSPVKASDESGQKEANDLPLMAEIVHRHFKAAPSYHDGDLLARSDVAELLDYLRKANGPSRATHPKLLKRVLPDQSFLVQTFHAGKAGPLLRKAAEQLGSYEPLRILCLKKSGRAELLGAIESGDMAPLVQRLSEQQAQLAESKGNKQEVRPTKIYNADELAEVIVELSAAESR